jgi:hypothetical protein
MKPESEGVFEGIVYKVLMNPHGFRCGYVRVPEGHPWYGKSYSDIDVDVHGGLTFSDFSETLGDGFWVGFDCAHAGDFFCADEMDSFVLLSGIAKHLPRKGKVRSRLYVESQCKKLASFCLDAAKEIK